MSGIIEQLQTEIEELKARVAALESREVKTVGQQILEATRRNIAKSDQQKRDEIVERAKKEIEELRLEYLPGEYYYVTEEAACIAEFIVNREKRTVVVLLRGAFSGTLYERGIAKCAPDECFNAHIGKAIALRRALGLEVPADCLNAPQPTEVRVGDVVTVHKGSRYDTDPFVVRKIDNDDVYDEPGKGWITIDSAVIIDDTREEA